MKKYLKIIAKECIDDVDEILDMLYDAYDLDLKEALKIIEYIGKLRE